MNVATWLQSFGYAAGPVSKGPEKLIGVVNIEMLLGAVFNMEPRMTATPNIEPVLVGEPEPS